MSIVDSLYFNLDQLGILSPSDPKRFPPLDETFGTHDVGTRVCVCPWVEKIHSNEKYVIEKKSRGDLQY